MTFPMGQGEPLNAIITGNSDPRVLVDAEVDGGLRNYFLYVFHYPNSPVLSAPISLYSPDLAHIQTTGRSGSRVNALASTQAQIRRPILGMEMASVRQLSLYFTPSCSANPLFLLSFNIRKRNFCYSLELW